MPTMKDLLAFAGKTKANILTRLRIDEVSSVDRGAGEGVHITLMKRDEPYWKREFSQDERDEAAKTGAAMSDGSYPIKNKSDLHNAMQAIGRAKDPGKVKAHIRARARALGLTSELSDAFKRDAMAKEDSISKFFANIFSKQQPKPFAEEVDKATAALAKSIASIDAGDPKERSSLLAKTFEQFHAHISKLSAAPADNRKTGENDMPPSVLKALGLKEGASDEDVLKAIAAQAEAVEKAKADLDEDEEDEDEKEKDPEKKKAFRAMTHEQRKAYLTKKYPAPKLPPEIQEIVKRAEEDRKEIQKLRGERELDAIKKVASDAGMAESEAVTIQKAYGGDKEAVDRLVSAVKAANAQAKTAGVWKEFGGTGGEKPGNTALDQLNSLAAELRKREPALSPDQAFAKVFSDPANRALANRERAENSPRAL